MKGHVVYGGSHLLAVVNVATMNIGIQTPEFLLSIFLDIFREVELLDHMVIICLTF